jgi:hypothetical protein
MEITSHRRTPLYMRYSTKIEAPLQYYPFVALVYIYNSERWLKGSYSQLRGTNALFPPVRQYERLINQ